MTSRAFILNAACIATFAFMSVTCTSYAQEPSEAQGKPRADMPEDAFAPKTIQEQIYEFIENIEIGKEDFEDLDLSVIKVALYRTSGKSSKELEPDVFEFIEHAITKKLLSARRLQIHECLQCKTTQVILGREKLVMSGVIESNERLRELGESLNVDGFVLWSILPEEKNMSLDLTIVDASTGEIKWNRHYLQKAVQVKKKKRQYIIDISAGVWGLSASREKTAGGKAATEKFLRESLSIMKQSSFSEDVFFGLGINFFQNSTDKEEFGITGFAMHPALYIMLGPAFGVDGDRMKLVTLYIEAGEAFFDSRESTVLLTGIKFNFRYDMYLSIGAVNINSKKVTQGFLDGYSSDAEFGGLSYDIGIGYAF